MLNNPQIGKMLGKLRRFEYSLFDKIFVKQDRIDFDLFETEQWLTEIPQGGYAPIRDGDSWGGENHYGWFRGSYTVPAHLAGQPLYLMPAIGCYEGMLFVDGKAYGTFANKINAQFTGHGNHFCDLIAKTPAAGQTLALTLELYCGHLYPGCHPFEHEELKSYRYNYNGGYICTKDHEIQAFYFDLQAVLQLADVLPEKDFRRGEVVSALYDIHNILYYDADLVDDDAFRAALRACKPILERALSQKSAASAPFAGLTGHSHMDTAWLWHMDETVKKCARTYSNALALMEEYPEYRFIQSSSCHSDFIRRYYPELFERIRARVKEGRYEPNGGVWVECDCNITGGESMIRQFLWGQRFTRKYFDYTADVFWLPDTFGYSAAIPQIMLGCGCKYFMTTKISWNDTNRFPYDTFLWQGIDGSEVLAHFNTTHHFPNVKDIAHRFTKIEQPAVTNMKYCAYGYGDGGGGPTFDMVESGRRIADLDGLGKSENMSAGAFMARLEQTARHPNTYRGELYLELHRGTLTNQHTIKRHNRKSEQRLHDLELLTVMDALKNDQLADSSAIAPLWEVLLKNQFHDILPGTCIHRAHAESRAQTGKLIADADAQIRALIDGTGDGVTLINTLPMARSDAMFIDAPEDMIFDLDCRQQEYIDIQGNRKLIVAGVSLGAFAAVHMRLKPDKISVGSAFKRQNDTLITPHAVVRFNEKGGFASFVADNRDLQSGEYALNTFLMAEDVPSEWDNWDVDADIAGKFRDCAQLLSSEVVSDGAVAYIIRNTYRLSEKSTLTQDVIFFVDSAEVRFDTYMDWNDDHRFLKTCFDTSIREDFARQEIQFGYVKRPTTRNTTVEQAKFEVLNHKYTDLSEPRSGVAILNDSKYGITVDGGRLTLSLHKGGLRPDHEGDKDGMHHTVYSFLPHSRDGFSIDTVVNPAYALNYPVLAAKGDYSAPELARIDRSNIIIETVKPCEDAQRAYIVRLYEAEGTQTNATLTVPAHTKNVRITNMLEDEQASLAFENGIPLRFRPFEIKTVKVEY